MRIDAPNGVIEIGWINSSRRLQRTVASTEAMFLFMTRAFDELGYRRYEWKCDSRNAPSRAAAARLGFQFEGIFRQAAVTKGRSRDTAWFSILDTRVAGAPPGLRGVAAARELRRRGQAGRAARGLHRALARLRRRRSPTRQARRHPPAQARASSRRTGSNAATASSRLGRSWTWTCAIPSSP